MPVRGIGIGYTGRLESGRTKYRGGTKRAMQWYKRLTQKVYHGAAFEHRIQASVGLSIVLCAVVIPISIMRIKQLKNRGAPVLPDNKGQKIANLISSKLTSRNIENIDKLQLQALKRN